MILQIRPALGGFHLSCSSPAGRGLQKELPEGSSARASGLPHGRSSSRFAAAAEERISILQKKLIGPAKLIRSGGGTIGETDLLRTESGICYRADLKDDICATAQLTCRSCSGAVSLIRPPQGVHLDIQTPYGEWTADRQKDQSVLFVRASIVIGKISPFFSVRPQIFACSEEYPAFFWAAMYVFASYMMHEGDVDII